MYVQTLERQELTDQNLSKWAFGTGQISGCNIRPAWTGQIHEVGQFAFVKLFEQPGWQASERIAGRQFLGAEALTTRGT